MKKVYKIIKENYIYINITFLILSIYVIFFPIISTLIQKIIPQFGICPYLAITGKQCPLCGWTRYIQNLPEVSRNITYLFNPFGIIIIMILIEIIFRIINIILRQKSDKVIRFDIIIHIIEGIVFVGYEILFFIV